MVGDFRHLLAEVVDHALSEFVLQAGYDRVANPDAYARSTEKNLTGRQRPGEGQEVGGSSEGVKAGRPLAASAVSRDE